MIYQTTHSDFEARQLLTEAVTNTATLASIVAKQATINPGFRIALEDVIEALAKVNAEAGK